MYIKIYNLNDLRLFCFAYNGIIFVFTHFSFFPFYFKKNRLVSLNYFMSSGGDCFQCILL